MADIEQEVNGEIATEPVPEGEPTPEPEQEEKPDSDEQKPVEDAAQEEQEVATPKEDTVPEESTLPEEEESTPQQEVPVDDTTEDKPAVEEEGEEIEQVTEETVAPEEQPPDGEATDEGKEEEVPAAGEEGEKEATERETSYTSIKEEPENEEQQQTAEGSPVPQSETFTEGERPESPVVVGERLSRGASPIVEEDEEPDEQSPAIIEPGTPEPGSEEESEEEEEFEEEFQPRFNREELIERYHEAIEDREKLQQLNHQFQHKLAEYFRKKKADESRQDLDKNVTDQEQRYLKYVSNLDELRRQDMEERENFKHQIEDLKEKCQEKQETVDEKRLKFLEFKKQMALNAINSRSGKAIPPKDIEQYLLTENRKEAEVMHVRLENIKLKNKLKKKEMQLKSKEELAEGLHLIDFEQLKIENQTYNEKIEERNEELLKLRKKITSTVQVLTHLKEKLQFVQAENQVQKFKLQELDELAAKKRDVLSRTKQARDALRIDNHKLRQNCGLLGNEPLLRDFEERMDEGQDLKDRLERLKMTHAELTLNTNGVRRKIEQARMGNL